VTVETGDPEVLAEIERFHVQSGQSPMISIDGDRKTGSIRRITYYLIDDELLHEMVGSETVSVFAPGSVEQPDAP
jgi:hypothetical protein